MGLFQHSPVLTLPSQNLSTGEDRGSGDLGVTSSVCVHVSVFVHKGMNLCCVLCLMMPVCPRI